MSFHPVLAMGRLAGGLWSATPNTAARAFIKPEVLLSPIVHPPDDVLDRCEYLGDMGGAESVTHRLRIWSDLLTGEH